MRSDRPLLVIDMLVDFFERRPELSAQRARLSAFFGTGLDDLLAALGARTLVLAGVESHACVRTTAIDACQRDHDVVLAAECVASYDAEHHDVTMRYLGGQVARLASNAQIAELFRSAPD